MSRAMTTLDTPKTWIPYMNNKDCSEGFCSIYCPQWCYITYSPPPPFEFNNSSPSFSPLVIAIICILASAFILVSYYTIISKYCGNHSERLRETHNGNGGNLEENDHNPSVHEPWQDVTTGLDDAFISSITVRKFRNGDWSVPVPDCSVCLSEFQEGESMRLLPKCSHPFHVPCIDTWLKSHSNCPLCRADIAVVVVNGSLPDVPAQVTESTNSNEPLHDREPTRENAAAGDDAERGVSEEEIVNYERVPKTPLRVFSDLGNLEHRDTIIEIRDEGLRRSVSMDHSCQNHGSGPGMSRMNHQEDQGIDHVGGSSKNPVEVSRCSNGRRVFLHCVLSPVTMKRSLSSGKIFSD